MKAPVTTHDLLLLAESKLSCTNVRNCDKRTQTTGVFFVVITMRINHGEHLPTCLGSHPWSSVLQTSPVLSLYYSNGKGWKERYGGRRKEKGTKTKHQCHKTKLRLHWTIQLIKGYAKGNIHSKKVIHILAQYGCLFWFFFFLNMKQKHKVWGGIAEKKWRGFYLYRFPSSRQFCRYQIS